MKNDRTVDPSGNRPLDFWNQFSPNFRGMLLMGGDFGMSIYLKRPVSGILAVTFPTR